MDVVPSDDEIVGVIDGVGSEKADVVEVGSELLSSGVDELEDTVDAEVVPSVDENGGVIEGVGSVKE